MDYKTFLSKAEYNLCLLRIFTGVDYLPSTAFDTFNIENGGSKVASSNESSSLFVLNFLLQNLILLEP